MSKTMGDMIDDNQIVASFDAGDYLPIWRPGNTVGTRNQVIEQSVLTAAFPQPVDTLANWISNDPVITSGVIAIISDENSYVVGNGTDTFTDLTMQYGPGKIKSLQDSDISTSDATYNMATINAYPVGYRGRVSWHSGDGSNDFQFVDASTSITLDGIDITDWVGEGTGFLDIVKTAADTWQTLNNGVWDSDGGGFSGKFDKNVSGRINQNRRFTGNTDVSTVQGNVYRSDGITGLTYPVNVAALVNAVQSCDSTDNNVMWLSSWSAEDVSTSHWQSVSLMDTNSATNISYGINCSMTGRWTTSYPRKS